MSEQHDESTVSGSAAQTNHAQAEAAPTPAASTQPELAELMAAAAQQGKGKPKVDLDLEALKAAEQALATGQKALEQAKTELGVATKKQRSTRELMLRGLLVVNVVAMLVVAWLPPATGATTTTSQTTSTPPQAADPHPSTPIAPDAHSAAPQGHTTPPVTPRVDDAWTTALRAADRQDWDGAIALLKQHLQDSPRMAPSQKLSVLMALGYYSSRINKFDDARDYQRQADAIEQGHSLPEDLVAMAKAAADAGDQEALRRIWARFLLQQKQIPSWLYKHVAEAYLQLGDSYRNAAISAAEKQRIEELEALAGKLRPQESK
ncbi:MAG: hypothetical protein RL398_370 [Planctomycetota bacterium]